MNIQGTFRLTAAILLLQTVVAHAGYHMPDRLTQIQEPNRSISYSLDGVANRITELVNGNNQTTSNDKTYSYNSRDQLQSMQDAISGATTSYQYDNNSLPRTRSGGNQIQKTDASGITTMSYGPRDRLLTITLPGAPPVNYSYNDEGLRDSQSQNGTQHNYLYDQQSLIAESNSINDEIARYTHSSVGLIAEARNGTQTYIHGDALSTPIAITDTTGAVTTRYTWDAWGNLQQQTGFSQQPFGFTGYQRDEQTGLHYAQQRYYDAETGRFNRHDPFRSDSNIPLSLHRYLYANANPTIYVDLDGRKTSFDIRFRQREKALLSGEISDQEFFEQNAAEAKGAIVGASLLAGGVAAGLTARAGITAISSAITEVRSLGLLNAILANPATTTAVATEASITAAAVTTGAEIPLSSPATATKQIAAKIAQTAQKAKEVIKSGALQVTESQAGVSNVLAQKVGNQLERNLIKGDVSDGEFGRIDLSADLGRQSALRAPITDPARLLPAPGAIARQDVPAFGLVVVNEDVFTRVVKRGILGREGSNNPGFFADPSELVGLSDEFVVQRLGNPFLGRKAVNNGEPLFGIQFPTSGQPIFNTLDFSDPNFVRGGRAVLKGPEEQNSFIIIQVREFNVPAQFQLPNGTIGGRLVNGAIQGSMDIR